MWETPPACGLDLPDINCPNAYVRSGLIAYASSLDCIGPMGRTVEDCALMLGAMAGLCGDFAAVGEQWMIKEGHGESANGNIAQLDLHTNHHMLQVWILRTQPAAPSPLSTLPPAWCPPPRSAGKCLFGYVPQQCCSGRCLSLRTSFIHYSFTPYLSYPHYPPLSFLIPLPRSKPLSGRRLGLVTQTLGEGVSPEVEAAVRRAAGPLETLGAIVEEVLGMRGSG